MSCHPLVPAPSLDLKAWLPPLGVLCHGAFGLAPDTLSRRLPPPVYGGALSAFRYPFGCHSPGAWIRRRFLPPRWHQGTYVPGTDVLSVQLAATPSPPGEVRPLGVWSFARCSFPPGVSLPPRKTCSLGCRSWFLLPPPSYYLETCVPRAGGAASCGPRPFATREHPTLEPPFSLLRFATSMLTRKIRSPGYRSKGGGVSRKRDILLNPPPRAKLKKGGGWRRVLRGFFAARRYFPRQGHPPPSPATPHPMQYIASGTSE